jgi:NitT/TauT family transport system ATP-binding protein
MIELLRVHKRFVTSRGCTVALANVGLQIEPGEFVCLVGPSGCGKTTILNLIAGLERPDWGEVRIAGRRVEGPGPDRGVMFQDAALFPWLTVEQNVEFGLKEQRVPRRQRKQRAAAYLSMVGMTRFAHAMVHELSGGMRQRVALARALALEPHILLMDEPFGALDARTREVLQAELVAIWHETHKTIVFVTHDMTEAVRLASRVVLLRARPAQVSRSVDIEPLLPRPRTVDQPAVIALAARLKAGLQDPEEMEDAGEPDEEHADHTVEPADPTSPRARPPPSGMDLHQ